ncbi:MAG: hypothetical protein LBJ62_10970 [Bifidobacteriaceae bacterium]|jgi:hypothetical protein|nr:hypothetical protein [Bifidobacteriaceae bacterium]
MTRLSGDQKTSLTSTETAAEAGPAKNVWSDPQQWIRRAAPWVASWLTALAQILTLTPAPYNGDMVTYVTAALKRGDPDLFPGDLFAESAAGIFSPQFFNDYLLLGVMRLGLTWLAAALLIYLICAAAMAGALVALADAISRPNRLALTAFLGFAITWLTLGEQVGQNSVWRNSWYGQTLAVALAVWGLAFVLRSHWWAGGGLLAAAALFHQQVSLAMLLVVAVLLIHKLWRTPQQLARKAAALVPTVVVVGVFYAALKLDSAGPGLSDAEFIAVYATFRHPHHLVPSAWYWRDITAYAVMVLVVVALLMVAVLAVGGGRTGAQAVGGRTGAWAAGRQWLYPTATLTALSCLVITANYLFVEVKPWALVAKLYPERYFIAFRVWVFILIAVALARLIVRRRWWAALIPGGMWALQQVLVAAAKPGIDRSHALTLLRPGWLTGAAILIATSCIVMALVRPAGLDAGDDAGPAGSDDGRDQPDQTSRQGLPKPPAPAGGQDQPDQTGRQDQILPPRRRILTGALAVVAGVLGAVCVISQFTVWQGGTPRPRNLYQFTNPPPVSWAEGLAIKAAVPQDAAFLADPYDLRYGVLHLIGQRTLAATWKGVPIEDASLAKWIGRLERLGLITRDGQNYYRTGVVYEELPLDQIVEAAQEFGASYLVTSTDTQARYDASDLVERVSGTSQFTVYRIR